MFKSINLGKKTKKKVLILDMDETLVSARFNLTQVPKNFDKDCWSFNYKDEPVHVKARPYLEDLLIRMADLYEIVVFTAGL